MTSKKDIFYFLVGLAYLSIIAVGYWECKYYLNPENELRHEFRVGAAMVMTFTSPILLGVSLMALFRIKKLTKKELISSFVPIAIIGLLILSWVI